MMKITKTFGYEKIGKINQFSGGLKACGTCFFIPCFFLPSSWRSRWSGRDARWALVARVWKGCWWGCRFKSIYKNVEEATRVPLRASRFGEHSPRLKIFVFSRFYCTKSLGTRCAKLSSTDPKKTRLPFCRPRSRG